MSKRSLASSPRVVVQTAAARILPRAGACAACRTHNGQPGLRRVARLPALSRRLSRRLLLAGHREPAGAHPLAAPRPGRSVSLLGVPLVSATLDPLGVGPCTDRHHKEAE